MAEVDIFENEEFLNETIVAYEKMCERAKKEGKSLREIIDIELMEIRTEIRADVEKTIKQLGKFNAFAVTTFTDSTNSYRVICKKDNKYFFPIYSDNHIFDFIEVPRNLSEKDYIEIDSPIEVGIEDERLYVNYHEGKVFVETESQKKKRLEMKN